MTKAYESITRAAGHVTNYHTRRHLPGILVTNRSASKINQMKHNYPKKQKNKNKKKAHKHDSHGASVFFFSSSEGVAVLNKLTTV